MHDSPKQRIIRSLHHASYHLAEAESIMRDIQDDDHADDLLLIRDGLREISEIVGKRGKARSASPGSYAYL